MGAARWRVEEEVQKGLQGQPILDNYTLLFVSRLFVPPDDWSSVLLWGHTSNVACHTGYHHTLALIQQRFWWPSMLADTCSICVRSKASHHAPAGLLHLLPIPSCPWSYITVDFVTGLRPSEGNTTILTIVDRFSKAVHFLPLVKLPSTMETANLLVSHVFCLHGIPLDIVSDRGPRFALQV